MENKLFNSSDMVLKHKIVIDVYENCCLLTAETCKGKEPPTYYEVIGVLETQKQHLIWVQREANMKKKSKPKKSKTK